MQFVRYCFLAGVLTLILDLSANAGLVEVVATGVVSDTDPWYAGFPEATGPDVGDPVRFRYVLDTDDGIPDGEGPNGASFTLFLMREFSFAVGSQEYSIIGEQDRGSGPEPPGIVYIADSDTADAYWVFWTIPPHSFLGFDQFNIGLSLTDHSGSVLATSDHPESFDLIRWDEITFTAGCALCGEVPIDGFRPTAFWISPTGISVNVVPEPSTLALLLASAVFLRRRCQRPLQRHTRSKSRLRRYGLVAARTADNVCGGTTTVVTRNNAQGSVR